MSQHAYLFIIGAAKCGTTALANLLNQHPDVCLSNPKEPDFFTNRIFPKGFSWYENCFEDKSCRYRLDSSVSYTAGWGGSSKTIAERIHQFAPDAKIIYLLRDPIERVWSSYWHALRNGRKDGPFEQVINNPDSDHITASLYTDRLSDYLAYFDSSHILLIRHVDLQASPASVLSRVGSFVGVDDLKEHVNQIDRQVNSSYQFNALGEVITKVIPLDFIKRCARFAHSHLPGSVSAAIRTILSNPVPEINQNQAESLKSVFSDDLRVLQEQHGIDLKTSKWWN